MSLHSCLPVVSLTAALVHHPFHSVLTSVLITLDWEFLYELPWSVVLFSLMSLTDFKIGVIMTSTAECCSGFWRFLKSRYYCFLKCSTEAPGEPPGPRVFLVGSSSALQTHTLQRHQAGGWGGCLCQVSVGRLAVPSSSLVSWHEVIYKIPRAVLLSSLTSLVTDTISHSDISYINIHMCIVYFFFVLRSLARHIWILLISKTQFSICDLHYFLSSTYIVSVFLRVLGWARMPPFI